MNDANYDGLLGVGLFFSTAILIILGLYGIAEPAQRAATEARFTAERVERGDKLYAENCTKCHGDNGEGTRRSGPALNTIEYLEEANNQSIFDLITDGRPNTAMPAWGQANGGPFTAEEVKDLTAFMRAWEETAPSADALETPADAALGAALFSVTCFGCHGLNGEGTETAPALNDKEKLATFDDGWYRQTIATGRPTQGMPTWGKVLSPSQINDLVAYIRRWEKIPTVAASVLSDGNPMEGAAVFQATCVTCHGQDGAGTDRAPVLNDPANIAKHDDAFYRDVITEGRLAQGMPQWGQVLSPEIVNNLVALIRSWEVDAAPTAETSGAESTGETSGEIASEAPVTEPEASTSNEETVAASNEELAVDSELLALGQRIFEYQAGGVGCAYCHGLDGKGQGESGEDAPNIQGMTAIDTKQAIGDIESMKFIELSDEEVEAVGAYVLQLGK